MYFISAKLSRKLSYVAEIKKKTNKQNVQLRKITRICIFSVCCVAKTKQKVIFPQEMLRPCGLVQEDSSITLGFSNPQCLTFCRISLWFIRISVFFLTHANCSGDKKNCVTPEKGKLHDSTAKRLRDFRETATDANPFKTHLDISNLACKGHTA